MGASISDWLPKIAGLLDLILNIVGLLLWFNWRAGGIKLPAPPKVSLVTTLQRTEVVESHRWVSFGCLLALLVIRPLLYCQIGAKFNWTAFLDVTAFALPFRSDLLGRIYLYSTLSFLVALGVVYASLLLLSVINTKSALSDHFSRLVTLQLGWIGKFYWPIRLLLAPVAAALLWMAIAGALSDLHIMPAPRNTAHAWQIAALLSLCAMISWKYVICLFLGLHIANSYVYLGNSSFWQYVTLTGHRLTLPLRWLPLRIGKLDLGPILLFIATIAAAHYASVGMVQLYRRLPL